MLFSIAFPLENTNMNTTSPTVSRPAFDPLLRLLHAWNALAILGLVGTSQIAEAMERGPWRDDIWICHIQIGYALLGGLVARLAWGLIGPATARWSDLWHPREWRAMLAGQFLFPPRLGHDVRASAAFLALYAVLAVMAGSGLALAAIKHNVGPLAASLVDNMALKHLFKEPHEAGFTLVLAFIGVHFVAMAYHRFVLGHPVHQAMITGTQHLPVD